MPTARIAAAWITFLGTAAIGACSRGEAAAPAPPPPEVSVARVVTRTIIDWLDATGRLAAIDSVELHPRVSGYIQAIHFTEGAHVKRGALLFSIDPRPLQQQVDRYEAERARAGSQLALARIDQQRVQHLFEARSVSRETLDQSNTAYANAQSAVDASEAALASARLDLSYARVTAPIDGRVSRAMITTGNLVGSASTLTTIVSDGAIYAYFDVDESAYLRLTHERMPARRVQMALADEQEFPHSGEIDFVDNQIDPHTGTIRARARFDAGGRLVPGLFARIRVQTSAPAPALLIDEEAVLVDQDRNYVYVVDPHNRALRKNVEVGRVQDDGLRVVTKGLSPNDRVIVHGVQKVFAPGMPVRPVEIAMGAPSPQDAQAPPGH
jgi:membrane fusion protein, multidrug efflux system